MINSFFDERDIVCDPKTPIELIKEMVGHKPEYMYLVPHNPAATPELLMWFIDNINKQNDETVGWVKAVIKHINATDDIFGAIFDKHYVFFDEILSRSPKTPSHVLACLVDKNSRGIKIDVARNPNASIEVANKLVVSLKNVDDELFIKNVFLGVVRNKNFNDELLIKFIQLDNSFVNSFIAGATTTSVNVLEKFINHNSFAIRKLAAASASGKGKYEQWPQEWVDAHFGVV